MFRYFDKMMPGFVNSVNTKGRDGPIGHVP